MFIMLIISWIIERIKEGRRPAKVVAPPPKQINYNDGCHIPKKLWEKGWTGKYNDMW